MILLLCVPFSSSKKLIASFVRVLWVSVFETQIDIELRRSRAVHMLDGLCDCWTGLFWKNRLKFLILFDLLTVLGESKNKIEKIFILDRKWLCTNRNLCDENETLNMTLHKVLAIFFDEMFSFPHFRNFRVYYRKTSIHICSSSLFDNNCYDVFSFTQTLCSSPTAYVKESYFIQLKNLWHHHIK